MPPVDAFASYAHYHDHLKPIWDALTDKGTFYVGPAAGIKGDTTRSLGPGPPTLVAGYPDLQRSRHRPHIFVEHGAGERWNDSDPHYSGGRGRESVILFLCPNQRVFDANEARYPGRSVIVGSPRLDYLASLPREPRGDKLRVVMSFHWDNRTWQNTRSALSHFTPRTDSRVEIRGHAHPRIIDQAEKVFARAGIETMRRFDDVVRWADVYACDNSSTLFEAAAFGIKIVYLQAPWYHADSSLRFGTYADLAPKVYGDELVDVVLSLGDVGYERMVAEVFGAVDGQSARRAVEAIEAVTNDYFGATSSPPGSTAGAEPTQPSLFGSR